MTKAEADRLLRNALEQHRRGETDAAYRVYREVLAQLPNHPTALHYMGLVAHRRGQRSHAKDLLRHSIRLDPKDPRAYNHLGQIVLEEKKIHEAIACFRRALEVDPQHTDALNNLANVLALNGQREQAIPLYRRALDIKPDAINSIYNLAMALKDDRAYEEALQLLQRAVEIRPDHASSRHDLGVLLEMQGRFDEAVEQYLAVQRLRPRHTRSLAALLALRSYRPDEQLIRHARELLADPQISEEDRLRLHRGLGKYCDREQHFDEAFAHFRAAKAAVRKRTRPFDEGALGGYFDSLMDTFSEEFFFRPHATGPDTQRPVFIVGMPRSGTTLAEQILASHPAVYAAGELQGIPNIVRGLLPDYPQGFPALRVAELNELARKYLAPLEVLAPPAALRVTDKLPVNFVQLGLIATLFPQARIVHCRRNPLDMGLSCFVELFRLTQDFTTDLEDIGRYFLQHERLMAHWRKVLPVPILEQRYESVVSDPQSASRALIEHCGLPWDEACLSFQHTDRVVDTPSRWQVRQPIYANSVGRWHHYEHHLEPLRRLFEKRGYDYDR
jgi:tetratricopeptide (TPR) repeat protein